MKGKKFRPITSGFGVLTVASSVYAITIGSFMLLDFNRWYLLTSLLAPTAFPLAIYLRSVVNKGRQFDLRLLVPIFEGYVILTLFVFLWGIRLQGEQTGPVMYSPYPMFVWLLSDLALFLFFRRELTRFLHRMHEGLTNRP